MSNPIPRRDAIRLAVLTAFGATFGRLDALVLGQEARGGIRVPLSDWKWLTFDYHNKRIAIPTSEVFAALEEAYGSAPINSGGKK